ncbi:MAG: FimB/Mfa2 family fimbrial subunit, partial [Tannerellaceae bacterium]|nr:FimB/Mfa2 family fimbrial subunit [Tannerellaceae bacterium]
FVKLMSVSICLLSFLFLTQGCLTDDLSVCGVRLSFNYTETPDGDNRFASDVRKANVYIFDAINGVFVDEYSATFEQLVDGHILPINLAAGTYDFITWGNIGDQFEKTSFVPGETTFDEARITLKALDNTIREYPDSMYYGNMRAIVKASDLVLNQEIDLHLMKNNKRINVTTRGLYDETSTIDVPSNPTFYCLITSKNGTYKFDNYPTGEQYKYITRDSIAYNEEDSTDVTLRSDFVVLREFSDNKLTDSRLKIIHSNGNTRQEGGVAEEEFLDVSLTQCLNTVVVAGGPPIEDIEEFDIEIVVSWTNGTYSITINDWNYSHSGHVLY